MLRENPSISGFPDFNSLEAHFFFLGYTCLFCLILKGILNRTYGTGFLITVMRK